MNESFKDTKIYTGQELAKSPTTQAVSSGMAGEQSQAVAKIQAALTIAAARPRDELGAIAKIVKSCQRKKVAEAAQYAYKRGGTLIEGPSIRLAQIIATAWGNIRFGFREIGAGKDYTEVEAFAWDLETNTEATRLFKVYHRRYTGDQKLTGERDKYENMASVAQRRVRACIEQVVPDDVFETAVEACNETLRRADPRSLQEKVESMVVAFDKIGVSKEQLEGFLGHALTAAVDAQVITLGKVYKSIVDGVAKREEFFNVPAAVDEAKKRIEQAEQQKKPRKTRSDKGKSRKKTETQAEPTKEPEPHQEPSEDPVGDAIKEAAKQENQPLENKGPPGDFNPVEELYALADQLWGQTAGSQLVKACEKHGVVLSQLTERDANLMIDVVAQQIEMTKGQNE